MIVNLNKPLVRGPEADQFLATIQGNILQSHGRNEAIHLFISFGNPTSEIQLKQSIEDTKVWINTLVANGEITTAFDQLDLPRNPTGTFQSLLLSAEGYLFLDEKRPRDGSFRDGMRERGDKLKDPIPTAWEQAYRYEDNNKRVHAFLIIADNDQVALLVKEDSVRAALNAFGAEILLSERGSQLRNAAGRAIEPFGYRDGISQPQFIVDNLDTTPVGVKFDQRTKLKRVLEEDRLADGHYGSFFVYRKLQQNVASFDQAVKNVALEINPAATQADFDFIGAQAVGRYKDGTPLSLSETATGGSPTSENGQFDYDGDSDGNKCPLHAHIRKTNPRESLGFFTDLFAREKSRRIARRGITYSDAAGGVGLIFMCYQADIKDQFEFMQRRWANSHNFRKRDTGLDPVIGVDGGDPDPDDHPKWSTGYDTSGRKKVAFGEHVRLRGGEYFFAPSMEGLRILGSTN